MSQLSEGWRRRRERILLHIERCALELLADNSADEVTVERIASAAGISKRTFFRYFGTRDEVLGMIPARQVEGLCRRVADRPRSESVLEAFVGAVAAGEDDVVHADLVLLWGRAMRRGAGMPPVGQAGGAQIAMFTSVIAAREELDPDDPRVLAWASALAGVISASFIHWLETDGMDPLSPLMADWLMTLDDLNMDRKRSARQHRPRAIGRSALRPD